MFLSPYVAYVVIAVIALVPGAVSWLLGYRLIQRLSDPALPEFLAGHRRLLGVIFSVGMACISCAAVLSGGHVAFLIITGILISYAGLVAAAYPLRRALYKETWSFTAYCLFYPRTFVGAFGFWLTLAALPALAAVGGEQDWFYSISLGILLVFWNVRYADVLRWSLRSQPLEEGDLLTDCRHLAEKCELPQVRFERIPLRGGVIANAMALPSLRGSSVLLTDTLLERFDRQEILAIAAHELAHFDHYNPAYLRRLSLGNLLLIAAGVAATPVARLIGQEGGLFTSVLWVALIVTSLAFRARGKQRQETMCDLKAVKLTGNAEAVMSALTKLYTIARMPRRLDNRSEQSATHPSLARRIRDIRKAAGAEPVILADAQKFESNDGRSSVTFNAGGLQWIDQDGIAYTLSYSHLSELRVDVKTAGSTRLVAVGPSARRWELTLLDADVARVQAVLDSIDSRLADPAPATIALTLNPGIIRIVVLATVTIVLSFSQVGMVLVAVLTWAKPTLPMFVGAGLAALTTAGFMLRNVSESYLAELWMPLAVLALFFFGLAWTVRRTPRDGTGKYLAVLAIAAALSVIAIGLRGLNVVELHRSAQDSPSATVFLVALAGALFCSTSRRDRMAGVAAAFLAIVLASIGSTAFLDRFGTDPFLSDAQPLRSIVIAEKPIATFEVPSNTSRIALSPGGQYIAIFNDRNEYRDAPGKVQVGRIGDALTSVAADDVVFVSDDKMLLLQSTERSTVLKAQTPGSSPRVLWEHVEDDMLEATLSLDRASARWALLGWDGDDTIVRVEGTLDGSAVAEKRWTVAQDRNGYVSAMASSGPDALVLETRYERGVVARTLPLQWTWAQLVLPPRPISHYATITDRGRDASPDSRFDINCVPDIRPNGALSCTAFDGSRTHVVTVTSGSDAVHSVGFVEGRFIADRAAAEGWLTGWIMGRPTAIHIPSGAVFRMPPAMRTLRLVPVSGDRLAVVTFARYQLKAVLYAPLTHGRSPAERIAQNRSVTGRP